MILVCAAIGLFVGSLLNWAGDCLPYFASGRRVSPRPMPRWMFAVWQLRSSFTGGNRPTRLEQSSRLNAVVELFTALLFAYVWERYGLTWNLPWLAFICSFFILIAVIDMRHRLVLNLMVFPAMAVTLILRVSLPGVDIRSVLIGGAFGLIVFLLAALVRPGGLGGGDVKLAMLIGFMFGFPDAVWALMLGILAGGVTATMLLLARRWTPASHIPYAPFLCLGALIALFYNPVSLMLHP